jgi:type I restriction enzyme, S subunit
MRDWCESSVAELADIVSGGTPSREISAFWNGGIPWVTPTDITLSKTNYLSETADSLSRLGLLNSSAKMLPAGAILFTSRASVGLVKMAAMPVCTNQGFKSLVPHSSVDGPFLFYQVERLRGQFQRYAAGSTFPEINKGDTGRVRIPHPVNRDEQRRIASVLEAVDAAIESTTDLVAKYQQIKAGLMYDVFTRGVLADGQLRPPHRETPELYQRTALGWIPKDWSLHRCADICTRICVGIVIQPTQYYVEEGVPALRSANVREEGIDPSNLVYISASANRQLAKSQLKAGDIVSVRTGYPGTSAVVPQELEGANCIDILISTPGDRVSSDFLCDWINSSFGKEQVLRQQGGMAQQHFNVGEMRELLVALPSLDEQDRISAKLSTVTQTLTVERARAEKYRAQKLGLMQDLLSGRVSVEHLVPELANA